MKKNAPSIPLQERKARRLAHPGKNDARKFHYHVEGVKFFRDLKKRLFSRSGKKSFDFKNPWMIKKN